MHLNFWVQGGDISFSGCYLLLGCIFHPKPFNWLHVIWIHNSQASSSTANAVLFQLTWKSPRLPHPWVLHINQTLQQSHFHHSWSNVHPEGHFCIALGSALGIVTKNWGFPKCHSSLLNGFAGIPLREMLSAHPILVIFLLCRMQIHNLEGKTMATPEIFPILAGLGQLAKVTYSKGHENYTHDTNVQWNIFKFRWNQVCNPSDAAALDNFSPFFSFLTFFSKF